VVLWRLRYKLALRDLPETFLIRDVVFSHEAVRDWEAKLTPALVESRGDAGAARPAGVGMSTRPTSSFTGIGVISTVPSIARARWST
jgi:hypothetical protein